MIRAILNILSSILGFIPSWRDRKINRIEGDWSHNHKAIDDDLGAVPWWVRDKSTRDEDKRSGAGVDER